MPADEIPKKYRDLLQKCLAGNQEAFKEIMLYLADNEKMLSKQDIVDFLFNREDFLKDLHQLPDDFKQELLNWYQHNEIQLSSKPLLLVFRMLQASKDTRPNDKWIFTIDNDVLAGIGKRDQAKVYNFRGSIFYFRKDYDSALADYSYAIRLDASNAFCYGNRGIVYYAMRNYDAAIHELNNAVVLDPQCANYFRYLASAHLEKGDYYPAIMHYTNVINLKPNAIDFENRAWVFKQLRNYTFAISDYMRASQCLKEEFAQRFREELRDNKLPDSSSDEIIKYLKGIEQKIVDCEAALSAEQRVAPVNRLMKKQFETNAELKPKVFPELRECGIVNHVAAPIRAVPAALPIVPASGTPASVAHQLPSISSPPVPVTTPARTTLPVTRERSRPLLTPANRELVAPVEKNQGFQCKII